MYAQIVTNVAGIVSYPLDTIRKRLMMTGGKNSKPEKTSSTTEPSTASRRPMKRKVAA